MNINISTPSYTARAYNATNFAASGGAILPISDEYVDRYKVINKTLFWEFSLQLDLVSTPTYVTIKLPNSYTAKSSMAHRNIVMGGANYSEVYVSTGATENIVYIQRADGNPLTDETTTITFSLIFEIE